MGIARYHPLLPQENVGIRHDRHQKCRVCIRQKFTLLLLFTCGALFFLSLQGSVSSLRPIRSAQVSLNREVNDCNVLPDVNDRFACYFESTQNAYTRWISSQSRTLNQAAQEYELRYKRPAPAWFPVWFNWAKEHNVTVIDDFDQLELDLKFLREGDRKQILRNMQQVSIKEDAKKGKGHVSLLQILNGNAKVQLPWAEGAVKALRLIVDPILHLLPDLEILVNWGDEPWIRAPERNATIQTLDRWAAYPDVAGFMAKPCDYARTILDLKKYATQQYKERLDICNAQELEQLRTRHGRFQHINVRQFNASFPLLSTAKMSTDHDILFPQRMYQFAAKTTHDPNAWESKSDSLYWRGSTSGQINTASNWNTTHRARFVFNTDAWERYGRTLRETSKTMRSALRSEFLATKEATQRDLTNEGLQALEELPAGAFNVSFTSVKFCDGEKEGCQKIESYTTIGSRMPGSEAFKHKLLFDLDGLGMSERYYSLLASNSVVLKQTQWSEWHDERLAPWVHFVPVSLNMQELPALVKFLLQDQRGKVIAKRIAEESQKYVLQSLSLENQSSYMLRLFFEYADLVR